MGVLRAPTRWLLLGGIAWVAVSCGSESVATPGSEESNEVIAADVVLADDIPVAHTPPGGYGDDVPDPVLEDCTEPLATGAPDMRGVWRAIAATRDGAAVAETDRALQNVQRIEQCGDRVTITSGGIIHDMRADGTEENGVDDVAERDFTTPVKVVATFEDGVHVLRPVGVSVEVTRRLDGDRLIWNYVGTEITLERIGEASDPIPTTEAGS